MEGEREGVNMWQNLASGNGSQHPVGWRVLMDSNHAFLGKECNHWETTTWQSLRLRWWYNQFTSLDWQVTSFNGLNLVVLVQQWGGSQSKVGMMTTIHPPPLLHSRARMNLTLYLCTVPAWRHWSWTLLLSALLCSGSVVYHQCVQRESTTTADFRIFLHKTQSDQRKMLQILRKLWRSLRWQAPFLCANKISVLSTNVGGKLLGTIILGLQTSKN